MCYFLTPVPGWIKLTGTGEGEGVRARGERGMWPEWEWRRLGECSVFVLTCSLCLRPCSEDGRAEAEVDAAAALAAGERQGDESAGLQVGDEEEQSEWPESELFIVIEAEASGDGVPGAELCRIMPGLPPPPD